MCFQPTARRRARPMRFAAMADVHGKLSGGLSQQLHRVGGLLLELIEGALLRRLVRPPAQDGCAMAKPLAAEVIVADLNDQFWLERAPLCRALRRPSARPARRVAGEAGLCDQRLELFR